MKKAGENQLLLGEITFGYLMVKSVLELGTCFLFGRVICYANVENTQSNSYKCKSCI